MRNAMNHRLGWPIGLALCLTAIGIDPMPRAAGQQQTTGQKPTTGQQQATGRQGAEADPKGIEFFEKKIRPALKKHCYECHSMEAEIKGGLRLDTRAGVLQGGESGTAIVAGSPDGSLLIEALRHEAFEMPPDGQLPESVIADFVKWIKLGAPDPRDGEGMARPTIDLAEGRKFWSFQPVRTPESPTVRNASWPRHDIDYFILARLEQAGLAPVKDANRLTLIRRATYALRGLPPSPDEVEAFSSDDSPQAFEKVINRLLKSPQFGERWGRHWLDVARYAESTGKERNIAFTQAWRYRDYVINAFNVDKPYDQFVREQIAGDLMKSDSPRQTVERIVATGFLTLGPKSVNERDNEQYLMDEVDDQIDTTSRAILALTVACARCHDHKFDPIPTTDYYALAGIFRSTETLAGVGRGSRNADRSRLQPLGIDTGKIDTGKIEAAAAQGKQAARVDRELRQLQIKVKRIRVQVRQRNRKLNAAARGALRRQLVDGQKEIKRLQQRKKRVGSNVSSNGPLAMAVRDRASTKDHAVCVRGEVRNLGDDVPRGFVSVVSPEPQAPIATGSGRIELARWLASPDNPLTARVMVNRVWHHLFGAGLVTTVDNFGTLGGRPSHPELLDFLAQRFMREGWSVKRLIRTIMLSRVYQLASDHDPANYDVDADNRLLWRMNRRRLDAEAIRDSILAFSGRLNLKPPSGSPLMNSAKGELRPGQPLAGNPEFATHRSVYLPLARGDVPAVLRVFDAADPSLVVGSRQVTTVANQALFLMNSPFVAQQSTAAAKRIIAAKQIVADGGSGDAKRVDFAYRLALSRPATDAEVQRALKFLDAFEKPDGSPGQLSTESQDSLLEAWQQLCQALIGSAEFRYVY